MTLLRLMAAAALLLSLSGCGDDFCGNEIASEVRSPDGQWKAVIFSRDCGATTAFSTQVSLLPANHTLPNDGGNLFVAETGAAPDAPGGGPEVKIRWIDNRHLSLWHHPKAKTFRTESQVTLPTGFVGLNRSETFFIEYPSKTP